VAAERFTQRTFDRVRLNVPDDWVDRSIVTLVSRAQDGFQANVVVSVDELGASDVTRYARAQSKELQRRVRDYRVHVDEPTKHGGRAAHRIEHSFRSPQHITVRQLQLFVQVDGSVFTASVTHAEELFDAARPTLLRILEELRIG
jgi:hypothetical protein